MSLSVSGRMARVKPSPTSAALALAADLRAAGRDIIGLGAGEPDFDTPQPIKDAAIAAIEAGDTKYTPVAGSAELKAAIQRKLQRENGLEFALGQICVSTGAKQSLFNLGMALLDESSEAIIPALERQANWMHRMQHYNRERVAWRKLIRVLEENRGKDDEV